MNNYGVLKGVAIDVKRDNDNSPHSEILMEVNGVKFRIAINVRSSRGPIHQRLIEHLILHDFQSPILDHARRLPSGWNDLTDGIDDDSAIDYIRSNMFRASDMKPVTHLAPGPNNDLFEYLEALVARAINDTDAVVYAFGERWGPEAGDEDSYFGFEPGNGVHLIHMNQGGSGDNNGTHRDGALVIDFPAANSAVAIFLKFQNQVWHTDDVNGIPIVDAPAVPEIPIPSTGDANPWPVIADDSPYHLVRIIAAMVNPEGNDAGKEFVTLLNISNKTLSLDHWQIVDKNNNRSPVQGSLKAGYAIVIELDGQGAQLSNRGGTITLLNEVGLKVDGVSYTRSTARLQRTPVIFT